MLAFDLLIRGGLLVDGSGLAARPADVGIVAGRITAVGSLPGDAAAARELDARGQVVCPGFIDAHSHSDLTLLSDPRGRSKVHQGVTTEVIGNCGLGVAPLASAEVMPEVREAIYIVDPDPGVAWTWRTMAEYLDCLESARPSLNVAALAGHLAIHASVMGYADRPASADELRQMQKLLTEALKDGAVGLSTGLMYAPISYSGFDELCALGAVLGDAGRVFAMHLRNYGDHLLDAVAEAVEVGRASGCAVQASHLQITGRRNWGGVARALEALDTARAGGVRVRQDCYPYLAGSANLSQLLPVWVHEGGTAAMLARLRSDSDRDCIRSEWLTAFALSWEDILVCWVRAGGDQSVIGKRVADIALERGVPPDVVALDLIAAEDGLVNMIAFGRSEDDLRAALTHPETMIGSDGLAVDPDGPSGSGHPHPRYYGCYPRLLATYVRDERVMPLEEAIRKSTSLVADTFGLTDRGLITEGKAADVVVFDPARIVDRATFLEPQHFPEGVAAVIVNGQVVIDAGGHTGARAGTVLRA